MYSQTDPRDISRDDPRPTDEHDLDTRDRHPADRDTVDDEPDAVDSDAADPDAVDRDAEERDPADDLDVHDADADDPDAVDRYPADEARTAEGDAPPQEPVTVRDDESVTTPAPVPTAFGATSVGAAVAASATAGPRIDDRTDDHDRADGADPDRIEDGTAVDADPDRIDVDRADDSADVSPAVEDRMDSDRADVDDIDADRADTERIDGEVVGAAPVADETGGAAPDHAVGVASPVPPVDAGGATAPAVADEPVAAAAAGPLWTDETVQGLRERWRDVQLRFVDDPHGAAGDARVLVEEAVEALTAALAERRADLDGWQSADSGDTERLRVAVRGYRDLLDQLLP